MSQQPPQSAAPAWDTLPEFARSLPQWVTHINKKPHNPKTGDLADTTDPATWASFTVARHAYQQSQTTNAPYRGVGVVLANGLAGIDLDHVINPDTGEVDPAALEIIRLADSYTEFSPSGTGVHILMRGSLPPGSWPSKRGGREMYAKPEGGRYFTGTGRHFPGTPLTVETKTPEQLAELNRHLFPPAEKKPPAAKPSFRTATAQDAQTASGLSDSDLIERMFASKSGPSIEALWRGDTSAHGGDDSAADLALCSHLAFWTDRDAARIDSLFRQSGLCRDKWDDREDYRNRTIGKALAGATEGYQPPYEKGKASNADASPAVIAAREAIAERAQRKPVLDAAALHGIAGEFVRMIEPHTESATPAILVQFLVCYGNAIGRGAHWRVEASKHYANIYACLVGLSSKGRKGTSLDHVRRVFHMADLDWSENCVTGGLSSGEGLISAVRDEVTKKEKDKKTGMTAEVVTDEGVYDKRLLCVETEFAGPLRQAGRDGSILSVVVRQAWDSGNLRTMTKNSPTRATGAHISIIGHITDGELRETLTTTDQSNGFANRFLWICTERSKLLPFGGSLQESDLCPVADRLKAAIAFARTTCLVEMDTAARALWSAVYPVLSEGRPGLAGSVTSRAEAQTMRLALLYALLDQSNVIRAEHLTAGLAVWQYADQSARFIFGNAIGNPDADALLALLTEAAPEGVTRTQINERFQRNRPKEKIDAALSSLAEYGLARSEKRPTDGRSVETWFAVTGE